MNRFKLNAAFPFNPNKWPFFYGYFIVVCSSLGLLMSAPGQTIGVSVFTDPLIDALAVSRLQLSIAYMVGTIGSSLVIRRAGRLLDVAGVRVVTMGATLGLGTVLLYMTQVDHIARAVGGLIGRPVIAALVMVNLGFFLMRFCGQGILALSSRTMLMRWFMDLRGRMNSIVGVFVSLTFSASPLIFELVIRGRGWRGAWLLLALIIGLGYTVFVFVFYRDNPEDSDLLPDGHRHMQPTPDGEPAEENWTVKQARRSKTFWIFNIGLSMFSLFITALTFHVVSIFEVAGMPRQEAISIFLPSSVIAVTLTILAGWMADSKLFKFRLKYLLMILIIGMTISATGILVLESSIGKLLIIIGNGIANGFFGTTSTVVWPRYYGREHLGEVNGFNMSFLVFFSAIGPTLFGWSFDVFGNYLTATIICLVVLAILFLLAFQANYQRKSDAAV